MAAISDILAWRNISTAVQKVETGIPNRLPAVFNTLTEKVLGDLTTYITFYGQRQMAKRAEYGAPSRAAAQKQVGEQSVKLLHFSEHILIQMELLLRLRQPNDLLAQTKAQELIGRAGADFRQRFDNTRIGVQTIMLASGIVYFDAGGNILPTSAGSTFSLDYKIPASNQNQLAGIITTSWADPSANVIQHIENVRVQMRRNTGRVLKCAFYGKNVAAYLFNNLTIGKFWQYNPQMFKAFEAMPQTIPNGFAGLDWYPMGDTFYEDQNGTVQTPWGNDAVSFTPEITRNNYTLYEGSVLVPNYGAPLVERDLLGAVNGDEILYGMGGYTVREVDPVGYKEIFVDTMLPWWKQPLELFQATVAF